MENYFDQTIMICDDNVAIHESLSDFLRRDGYHVLSVYDGESALDTISHQSVQLLVLDIMLPRMSGLEVCRDIRKSSNLPILMLSARGDESDRIAGLEAGADDYIQKPFSPYEVSLRIRRHLQNAAVRENILLQCGDLCIYPERYEVYIENRLIDFKTKEIEFLAFFAKNAGKVLTREHILNAVWGYDYYGDARIVDTLVKRIRQKIAANVPDVQKLNFSIKTVHGIGYKLETANHV